MASPGLGIAVYRQAKWQLTTICQGGTSIMEQLRNKGINPDEYIEIYSLRNHAKLQGIPITEMVYVHSKILIVDDNIVLIGSGNINDRSLIGRSDSEIDIIIEDNNKVQFKMGGIPVIGSELAHNLRKQIYAEHTGLGLEDVDDPLNLDLLEKMKENARRNTEIYREIFACYPDDSITKMKQIKTFQERRKLDRYDELAPHIKGHIVQYPTRFLSEEKFKFKRLLPDN